MGPSPNSLNPVNDSDTRTFQDQIKDLDITGISRFLGGFTDARVFKSSVNRNCMLLANSVLANPWILIEVISPYPMKAAIQLHLSKHAERSNGGSSIIPRVGIWSSGRPDLMAH